jgi:hypothetical protein
MYGRTNYRRETVYAKDDSEYCMEYIAQRTGTAPSFTYTDAVYSLTFLRVRLSIVAVPGENNGHMSEIFHEA